MGNGEIARNEQFLLFPRCFLLNQIILSPTVHIFDIISLFAAEMEEPKIGISGKGLFFFYKQYLGRRPLRHCGEKGENAVYQHFLFFFSSTLLIALFLSLV